MRASHQLMPAVQLPFGRLRFNPAPVSFTSGGGEYQLIGPRDDRGERGFHAVHTTLSWRVCTERPFNRCGDLLSKLAINHQVPAADWWPSCCPQPAVLAKLADELDGDGHSVVVKNGKKEGLGVQRNVPYEFTISRCVVRT